MFCPQRDQEGEEELPRLATNPKYKDGEGHPNGRISSKSEPLLIKDPEKPPDPEGMSKILHEELRRRSQSSQGSEASGFISKCRLLIPYMWPKDNRRLKLQVVASFFLQAVSRAITLLVPIYYKTIVDSLVARPQGSPGNLVPTDRSVDVTTEGELPAKLPFRWDYILIYTLLISMIGPGGYLTAVRNVLWFNVQQYTVSNLRIALFEHLHSLSLRWHLNRKTGEVMRVIDRGVNGVSQILNLIFSQLVPVVLDTIIAVIYFMTAFDIIVGVIVCVTMVTYAAVAMLLSEWRNKYRRKMNDAENVKSNTVMDSILNYETVKMFAAEKWETNKYAAAVYEFQQAEWWVQVTANFYGSARITVMNVGFLAGALLTAWYVCQGRFTPGDYVMYAAYVMQLYQPLNLLGAYYRLLQQAYVDMEHMYVIFDQEPEIQDLPQAKDLIVSAGRVDFRNVCFSYSIDKPILKNINFTVPPGQTFALVGESGGGKSTLVRLMFRMYDLTSGAIRIDGQDIAKVTQSSLREQLGIVPQETGLFNDNLRYNIRYGNVTATSSEVEGAARAADIHERIISFPFRYDTRIGERGFKLSGGERQRVAIARMLLKSPKLILLDEATSSLDTRTERSIQNKLSQVCEGRTTLIIAHRLSTVVNADQILVIHHGQIVERGRHEGLLSQNGLYAEMWQEQQLAEEIEHGRSSPLSTTADLTSSFSSADLITQRSHSTKADDTLEEIQAQPLTESVVSFSGIQPSLSENVWPRRDVGSLTNLNPAETDISRLQNADRKRHGGGTDSRDCRAIEHTISLCDAFNVVPESDDPKSTSSDKSRLGQLKRSNSKHQSMIW